MAYKKGVIHLGLILILLIIAIVAYLLISKFISQKSSSKESAVELRTGYKNPFDKDNQYVNPFDQYKNPMINLK